MKNAIWKKSLAPYIKNPAFASYGAFEEKRPVKVDCSLGINPLPNLYNDTVLTISASDYGCYPKGGAHGNALLAEYLGKRWPKVQAQNICFGAGSQGTISSLSRILGASKTKVLGLLPQFIPALLEFATAGATIATVPLQAPDYNVSADLLIQNLQADTTVVYLDNPHNPTGQMLALSEIAKLADACLSNGSLLIVDEAYGDFVDDANSALNLEHENLICMRSFSKGCGLAGLRIGYIVIRSPELLHYYRELGLHFSASAASADMAARLVPSLDLVQMRSKVGVLKKQVLSFIGKYRNFSVAKTSATTPIFLLTWQQQENLYDALMEVGIQTEPCFFFAMQGNNSVRLRTPMQEQLPEFYKLWEQRFGKV